MASSKLYPPLIDKSLPAFVITKNESAEEDEQESYSGSVRIYFAPSIYNSIKEASQLQLTLRNRDNNASALSESVAKTSIKVIDEWYTVGADEDPILALSDYKYYTILTSEDLTEGWTPYKTYKVQLRFGDEVAAANITPDTNISVYQDYQDHFSEWSTVCLIRPIEEPKFSVITLESDTTTENVNESVNTFFTSIDSDFIGSYTQPDASEPLLNWRMTLYDAAESVILADTDWILFNSYDYLTLEQQGSVAFEGHLKYQLSDNTSYVLVLYIETKNGYKSSAKYTFTVMANSGDPLNATVSASINEDEAYAIVKITSIDNLRKYNNITIRRTSSRSNFTIWEDVRTVTFANQPYNYEFYDFTIESGVFYQYGAQTRDIRGRRGKLEKSEIIIGEFEDAFLVGQGQQLKLKYDFQISNSNITISESKTDTIGSKYPFVRRNGNMYYRTLQCSGLITDYMDKNVDLFITDAELYNNTEKMYHDIQNQVNSFVNTYDYTQEREFRHAVMTFLYDNKVKLFKSSQEGNILVKLMSISLTPKQELGRLLYNFSATLVEVAERNLDNYDIYNIQSIGNYSTDIVATEDMFGQLQGPIAAGENIVQILKDQRSTTTEQVNYINFSNIKIEISDDAVPEKIQPGQTMFMSRYGMLRRAAPDPDEIVLGWRFRINGNSTIIVPYPKNSYEIDARYFDVDSLEYVGNQSELDMLIKYVGKLEKQSSLRVPVRYISQKVYGQLFGWFESTTDIIQRIRAKYYIHNDNYHIEVSGVYTLEVWADEGTQMKVQTSAMPEPTITKMNPTELLTFDMLGTGATIESFQFTEGAGAVINYYIQVLKGVY